MLKIEKEKEGSFIFSLLLTQLNTTTLEDYYCCIDPYEFDEIQGEPY